MSGNTQWQVFIDPATFYASVQGGRCLFAASSGSVNPSNAGIICAGITNPSNTIKSLFISSIYYSSINGAITFVRYRNATITGGTSIAPMNQGGGPLTSVATFVTGKTVTINASGGQTTTMTYQSSADYSDAHPYGGTIILPPGDSLHWIVTGSPSDACVLDLVWWEI